MESFNNLEILSVIVTVSSRVLLLFNESYDENEKLSILFSIIFLIFNSIFFVFAIFYAYKLKNWKKMVLDYKQKLTEIRNIIVPSRKKI